MGRDFRLTERRGQFIRHPWARLATATVHPSAILRVKEEDQRHREYQRFVEDLRLVSEKLN